MLQQPRQKTIKYGVFMIEFRIQEVNHFLSILIRVFRDINGDSMGTFDLTFVSCFGIIIQKLSSGGLR